MSAPEEKPSAASTAAPADDFQFTIEERVLCYHGPLIYEAKCLKRRKVDAKRNQYFVHYNGWNKNWDEWVEEHRVLKLNQHNQKLQQDLKSKHNKPLNTSSHKKRKGSSSLTSSQDNSNGGGRDSNGSTDKRLKTDSQKTDTKSTANNSANGLCVCS